MDVKCVADYIKHLADVFGDNELTKLKLQKLLYYSYAYYLVFKKERLFNSRIEKWQYGPVVPEIWESADKNWFLTKNADSGCTLTDDQKTIIQDVYKVYGRYAAWTLSEMTHAETPWLKSHMNCIISDKAIVEFFEQKKEEFVFEVECLEDVEYMRNLEQVDEEGVDWEDLKAQLNARAS